MMTALSVPLTAINQQIVQSVEGNYKLLNTLQGKILKRLGPQGAQTASISLTLPSAQ